MPAVNKTYLILIYGIALLLLGVIGLMVYVLIFNRQSPVSTTISQVPTPSAIPLPTGKTTIVNDIPTSPLQKTTIGKTSDAEVAKRSDIIRKETLPSGAELYTIKSPLPLTEDEIYTKNGRVIFESTSIFTTNYGALPSLPEFEKTLGKPEEIVPQNKLYGWFSSAYIYPSKGYMLIANKFTYEVYEVERFVPMSLEDFKKEYGSIYLQRAPTMREEHYKIERPTLAP